MTRVLPVLGLMLGDPTGIGRDDQPARAGPLADTTMRGAGIVGKGVASTGALEQAIRLCAMLATSRRAMRDNASNSTTD